MVSQPSLWIMTLVSYQNIKELPDNLSLKENNQDNSNTCCFLLIFILPCLIVKVGGMLCGDFCCCQCQMCAVYYTFNEYVSSFATWLWSIKWEENACRHDVNLIVSACLSYSVAASVQWSWAEDVAYCGNALQPQWDPLWTSSARDPKWSS